jgi:hypothetical protein
MTAENRWVVTSTWGQQHIVAADETDAEEAAEVALQEMRHGDAQILDGLTVEWDERTHGPWEP